MPSPHGHPGFQPTKSSVKVLGSVSDTLISLLAVALVGMEQACCSGVAVVACALSRACGVKMLGGCLM